MTKVCRCHGLPSFVIYFKVHYFKVNLSVLFGKELHLVPTEPEQTVSEGLWCRVRTAPEAQIFACLIITSGSFSEKLGKISNLVWSC